MSTTLKLPEICEMSLVQAMRPEVFKALCDPNRIAIVATLATKRGPSNVSDIAEGCGIDFSGVSRHLKILKEAGLLSAVRQGRTVQYALKSDELIATLEGLTAALKQCGAQASI